MALTILPNQGQNLLVTRDAIKNNFQTIQTAFLVNHGDYGSPSQGKHLVVTMPYQEPSPKTDAGEMALYTQGGTLYLQTQSQIAGTLGIPLSGAGTGGTSWTKLPSGIIMKWGTGDAQIGPNSYSTGTFPVSAGIIPVFTNIFSVQVTLVAGSGQTGSLYSPQVTTTAVQAYLAGNQGPRTWYYFVIGN